MSEENVISMKNLPQSIRDCNHTYLIDSHFGKTDHDLPLKEAVQLFEKRYILQAIEESSTLKECAEKLNIGMSTLMRKKSKFGIK